MDKSTAELNQLKLGEELRKRFDDEVVYQVHRIGLVTLYRLGGGIFADFIFDGTDSLIRFFGYGNEWEPLDKEKLFRHLENNCGLAKRES